MTSGRGFPGQRTSKKLMLRVRPGVELVRAILSPMSVLITLDLPTFDRPRKATSGRLGAGKCAASVAAARNRAITLMLQCAMRQRKLASGVSGDETDAFRKAKLDVLSSAKEEKRPRRPPIRLPSQRTLESAVQILIRTPSSGTCPLRSPTRRHPKQGTLTQVRF